MQNIYTPLAKKEEIMKEILDGVALQEPECSLIGIKRKPEEICNREEDEARNVNEAKERCTDDIFVIMDSDVKLLSKDVISILINTLKRNPDADATIMPTRLSHQEARWTCSLMAVRKDKLKKLPEHNSTQCCDRCEALKSINVIFINNLQEEIPRC